MGGGTKSGPQHNSLQPSVSGQTLPIQAEITATINVPTAVTRISFNIGVSVVEVPVLSSTSSLTLVLYGSLGKGLTSQSSDGWLLEEMTSQRAGHVIGGKPHPSGRFLMVNLADVGIFF